MKTVFCSDLDSCLADSDAPLLARVNQELGLQLSPEDITQYAFEPLLEGVLENPRAWLTDLFDEPDWVSNYPLILPALSAMRKIRGMVTELHIVTARRDVVKDATRAWLFEHGFPYDKIVHTQDKAGYCREVKASYIFEDAPHHAEACHAAGVGVFLMDKAYNRNLTDRGGLWRVTNPLEIIPILKDDLAR